MDKYSISELITTTIDLTRTKLFYNKCRLIRFPFYIRGNSRFEGGNSLTLGRFCRFEMAKNKMTLHIGSNCQMGDMTHLVAMNNVTIGDDVLMASKCFISDTSHGNYGSENSSSPLIPPNDRPLTQGEVVIGNRVWIGENVVILAGVHIGDGAIIGANSVITKDIPSNCIAVGNNRLIKKWNDKSERWEKYDR